MVYDIAAKVTVQHAKEAILRHFLAMDYERVELIEELPQETVSLRRSDFPLRIQTPDGQQRLLVLEFQSEWEPDVPLRLAEYVIRYRLRYGIVTEGAVVLFQRREGLSEVFEEGGLRFAYRLVRLWEMSAEEVLREGELGLLPFVPLMAGGDRVLPEAEERLYRSTLDRAVRADLLTALAVFAGFGDPSVTQELLRRRRDIMRESITYELIKQEGRLEGREQGLQEGMLEDAREMVLEALASKFGAVPLDIAEQVKRIQVREVLRLLLRAVIAAEDLETFRQHLARTTGQS